MRHKLVMTLAAAAGVLASVDFASAACSAAASPIALQNFNRDPAAWLKTNGGATDVGAQVAALAAAAVNGNDAGFGKNLGALLGAASGDQGKAIGSALGGLGNTCSDPRDPTDAADKRYISTNIAPNVLTNTAANASYGLASSGAQTASTGGGGGGGSASGGGGGVGSTGSGLPAGGANGGSAPTGGTGTPGSADPFSASSGGSSSPSTVASSTPTGSAIISNSSTSR